MGAAHSTARGRAMNPLIDITSLIQNGPFVRAQKIVLYGPEAVGKSTLAAKFPNPFFIDTEDGSLRIDTRRIRAGDGETFYSAIRALAKAEQAPCETLVIDTIDAVEVYVRDRVLRVHQLKTIEGAAYGSGWALFRQEFNRLLAEFDKFIQRGIHVVVVSHATTKHFQSPLNDVPYDRFELNLYQPNAQKLKQWCDALLFMDWETRVVENRSGKARGVGGKSRVLHTQHCAAFDAKSRVSLPEKLPAEFDALQPLFGATEKEVIEKQPAAAASASTSEVQDTAPPPPVDVDLRDKLNDAIGDLDRDDVRHYLATKLQLRSGLLDELSANQITWIINNAEKFRANVRKFANEPF
jgi:AAA domain-containing protein